MLPDAPLALLIAAGTTLPLGWVAARGSAARVKRALAAGWLFVFAGLAAGMYLAPGEPGPAAPPADRPIAVAHDGYVGSVACRACHPGEYATWHRSYHRTMTQHVTPRTMIGPFDGVVVMSRGRAFALESRDDEVWVTMDDPEWNGAPGEAPRVTRQIVQSTGSHSEQFYWISSGRGRNLTILPIMYRSLSEQHWQSLDGCCITEPDFVQDLAEGRWNQICNRCHSTHAQPRLGEGQEPSDTVVAELGIACEACHGPGGEHAEAYRNPLERYALHASDGAAHAIVNPRRLSKERSAEVCGQCHGVTTFVDDAKRKDWRTNGFSYRPGDTLGDTRFLAQPTPDRFWKDGMIRVSGREQNGLVRSPCYVRGEMQCLSCHSLHRQDEGDERALGEWADDLLRPGMEGDRACTQCHTQFTEVAARAAHTHHTAGSAGDACMNCHMPYTTYGLLKSIRSHEVSTPSVQESVEIGRPNACNLCHLDRSLAWAADGLERWYGIQAPALDQEQRNVSAAVLWTLRGDAGQRVLSACAMGWEPARAVSGSDWMVPYLMVLLQDPYKAVRNIAHRTLLRYEEGQVLREADPLAENAEQQRWVDPVLSVWSRGRRGAKPSVLIDARGQIAFDELKRILAQRDERPVVLNE